MDFGTPGQAMNTAFVLADCSQDFPRKEWPGVKLGEQDYVSVVSWEEDQRKFCSLQLEIKAGLRGLCTSSQ